MKLFDSYVMNSAQKNKVLTTETILYYRNLLWSEYKKKLVLINYLRPCELRERTSFQNNVFSP